MVCLRVLSPQTDQADPRGVVVVLPRGGGGARAGAAGAGLRAAPPRQEPPRARQATHAQRYPHYSLITSTRSINKHLTKRKCEKIVIL